MIRPIDIWDDAVNFWEKVKPRGKTSKVDEIPGVGPARKKALLRRFGSLLRLRQASEGEIAQTPGIGPELAKSIAEHLHAPAGARESA